MQNANIEDIEDLRDSQKELEKAYDYHLIPRMPAIFRLDGRCFSSLTRSIHSKMPFSKSFQECMVNVTKSMIQEFRPDLTFVGSDEISLIFDSVLEFDYRLEKYLSLLSSFASVEFYKEVLKHEDLSDIASRTPHFDCRVVQCSLNDVIDYITVRKAEVVRNAERTLLRHFMSHNKLQGHSNAWGFRELEKTNPEVLHYFEDHPEYLGSFICYKDTEVNLTQEELNKIPERYRPNGPVIRKVPVEISEDEVIQYIKEKL